MDLFEKTFSLFDEREIPDPIRWVIGLVIMLLLIGVGSFVYGTGGIKYVYSHSMYVVILLAAIFFGGKGGFLCGLLGGVVLGPFMPIDVSTGESQEAANWLYRTGFFILVGSLFGSTTSHLRQKLHSLHWSGCHDAATGLPNKVYLHRKLATEEASELNPGPRALVNVKINNFFEIINTLGLDSGETLALQAFRRIRNSFAGSECVCQTHADRFSVLLSGSAHDQVKGRLGEFMHAMKKAFQIDGIPVYADFSVGLSVETEEMTDPMQMIQQANIALHKAERTGQDLVIHDASSDIPSKEQLALIGEIPEALDKDQFSLHYQPKVDLGTGRVLGVEALLRWDHPERGPIPPGRFVFQIEDTGLIHNITRWVATKSMEQLSAWRREGLHLSIAFNISTRNFLEADLLPFLRQQIEHFGIAPNLLELEITESAVMSDVQNAVALLGGLRELGVSLSVDDFGTGHSSLAYLKHLPVDSLKIDQVFARSLIKDPIDRKIVNAAVTMARELGLKTVAEGVEDRETFLLLKEMGCDIGQGYYFCRPQPPEQISAWLRQSIDNGVPFWPAEGISGTLSSPRT